MYQQIKKLFNGRRPSVKTFNLLLEKYPEEERGPYYEAVYRSALQEWDQLPQYVRQFYQDVTKHDRQRFLDFLRDHTILGAIRYPLRNPSFILKLIELGEGGMGPRCSSRLHFAFSCLLVFKVREKPKGRKGKEASIDRLCNFWREVPLTSDELLSLKAKTPLINRHDEWERTI